MPSSQLSAPRRVDSTLGSVGAACDRQRVHTTDLIELLSGFLSRPVRRLLAFGLCVALMTGVGAPLVQWFIEMKAHEIQSDLQPVLEQMVSNPTSAATP